MVEKVEGSEKFYLWRWSECIKNDEEWLGIG